ncbi:MAG TPA: glycosyltransferase family 2 protein [Selenomonadales bacterium]|nr:glycosyltransferase family 2 protein [Selenomonadales bacterium]
MNNLVSIIIPAYNVEKYIGECLASVQAQTFANWQAIVVDDGSTDKTAEVIQTIIQQDNRFRLIRQPNGGVSKARNTGIEAATGAYLAFLDGDDMWEPAFLAELMKALQAGKADMAYCGYTHLYAGGIRRKFSYPYASGRVLFDVIQGKTQIHIGAILVKKDLVDRSDLRFTEGCLVGQDQEFIWKLVAQADVQAVAQELMLYRIRSGSAVTAQWKWQKHIHALQGFKRAAEYILQHAPAGYDCRQLSQALHERIGYKLYKFIWRMIKNGYDEEALQLLDNEEYNRYLSCLAPERMKAVDRLKYGIVTAKAGIWWKLAKLF